MSSLAAVAELKATPRDFWYSTLKTITYMLWTFQRQVLVQNAWASSSLCMFLTVLRLLAHALVLAQSSHHLENFWLNMLLPLAVQIPLTLLGVADRQGTQVQKKSTFRFPVLGLSKVALIH